MSYSIAASHARGKFAVDKIFGASAAANVAKDKFGKDKVVDATIGALLDNSEQLVCLPTLEKVYRGLPMNEVIAYAPIAGLPDFLEMVQVAAFADNKPEAYTKAIATSGGSGAIHHTIWNYSEIGDTILTSDWFWGPYRVLADGINRKLDTFNLFDAALRFNANSFAAKVNEWLVKQDSLVIILNSPANNPAGYSLSDGEWDQVIETLKQAAKNEEKRITLLVDIAYIDFAGEKNAVRSFMRKFTGLPRNVLIVIGYSMSKSFSMYGQRTGAMIGISSDKDVITEFENINQYMNRATWSNINRAAQKVLAIIQKDATLTAAIEAERAMYYQMIRERADILSSEAAAVKLDMLPYIGGFFASVPAKDPEAVCNKLHDDNIFAVPLAKGVRIAVCAVPAIKVKGMAAKFVKAIAAVE